MTTKLLVWCLCLISSLSAVECMVNGTFQHPDAKGVPKGWFFNRHATFLPQPNLTQVPGPKPGTSALQLTECKAKGGCAFHYKDRLFPGKAGDRIQLRFWIRGTGTATASLYQFTADKAWNQQTPRQTIKATPDWKHVSVELTLGNGMVGETRLFAVMLGAQQGFSGAFADVKATYQPTLTVGDAPFPRTWMVFPHVSRDFQPTPQQLKSMPASLDGVTPQKLQKQHATMDLTPILGGQKARNCAWLFAQLHSPIEGDYTIGAGADWWMTLYVNGQKAIDTSTRGNGLNPPRIDNFTATVRLNRGTNTIAVKFLTGGASSLIALGGPLDLRSMKHRLVVSQTQVLDDFEIQRQRSGSPKIITGTPTPGLLSYTQQALYAGPQATLATFPNCTLTPKASNARFATGLRLQSFKTTRNHSTLTLDFGNALKIKLKHDKQSQNLTVSCRTPEENLKTWDYPCDKLPADLLVALSPDGFELNLHSLVDSSLTCLNGTCDTLQDLADKPFQTTIDFTSPARGELLVDNLFLGQATHEILSSKVPFDLDLQETFDPIKAHWPLVFQDEFNGKDLDWSKWFNPLWGRRTYDFKNYLSLKDGKLWIKADLAPDGKQVRSASITSKLAVPYGYFEAKVRFTRQPGWWAAFWLYSQTPLNPVVDGIEVDCFEDYYTEPNRYNASGGGNTIDHNLHTRLNGVQKSWNYTSVIPGPIQDFYVFGVKKTPFEISYYINGKLIPSKASHSPYSSVTFDAFNHVFTTIPLQTYLSGSIVRRPSEHIKHGVYPEYFVIDYVRIYEYPRTEDPTVTITQKPSNARVRFGETFQIKAEAKPNAITKAPIKTAYLFDNGYLIDYKTRPPYDFTLAIDAKHYDNTAYMRPGRVKTKPTLSGWRAYMVAVQDTRGKVAYTEPVFMIPVKADSTPYRGKPQTIPGVINIGHLDEGGQDVAYFDTTKRLGKSTFRPEVEADISEHGVGSVAGGEWLNYTVDIQHSGSYDVVLSYGTPLEPIGTQKRTIMIMLDGKPLHTFQLTPTKGWGDFTKTAPQPLTLPRGKHLITILPLSAANLGPLEFTLNP